MKYEIIGKGAYDHLKFELNVGEEVFSQAGAYMMHKGDLDVETKSFGILKGLKRMFLGGESFFLNRFYARSKVELYFSPSLPGKILELDVNEGEEYYIRDSSYLVHAGNMDIDTKSFGLKGLFTRSGFFWLSLKGNGKVWLNVYGDMFVKELNGETIYVDNTQLLALSINLDVKLTKLGNMKSFFFGGEGFIFKITGTGKVILQTRNLPLLAHHLLPFLHCKK